MIKKIVIIIATILIIFTLFRLFSKFVIVEWGAPKNDIAYNFVAHEGGGIDNKTYTNSKEALDQALKSGFKLVELDLIETSDNHLVAAHHWGFFREISGGQKTDETAMSLADFRLKKIHGEFSPLDANQIDNYMNLHKDLFLVVDKSNNFSLLNNSFSHQDRILVEVFGLKNYIKSILFMTRRPMYSLVIGPLGMYFEYFKISLLGVRYVVAHSADIDMYPKLFELLKNDGIKLLIYTSNNGEFISENISKYDAILYTDFWDFNNSKCMGAKCDTY